jgi:OCT family organic cation transporter-like MFS transporter 4/5
VGQGALNPYLMFILSSIAEIVGYTACHMNDRFGRKKMFIVFLALSSMVCLAVAIVPIKETSRSLAWNSILVLVMASFGKASVSAAYSSLFIYTCQLFPTKLRNTLLLFVSSVGRLGSIVSPTINLLSTLVWKPMPYFIFSSGSFLACIFVFILTDPANSNYF